MAYRKLGVDNKHRRSMLANLTRDVIKKGKVVIYDCDDIKKKESKKKEVYI